MLRKEKKISQKRAADALGVSQALLSHYENGVREPGLSFVVNAANYYRVSLDYLLGRTMHRGGMIISEDDMSDISREKENLLSTDESADLNKKLLLNSTAMLYDILSGSGDDVSIGNATKYLCAAYYKVFRLISLKDKGFMQEAFSIPEEYFSELFDAKMKKYEFRLRADTSPDARYDVSIEKLQNDYPQMAPALFSVLHSISEEVKKEAE
ncbi:MAG: helix-turn-helix transcriptional regulator [Clostridia bacterium]|nr:helix-turn-helix transcriptional regulator [Clostridia bacterium]